MIHNDTVDSREADITYHLAVTEVWNRQKESGTYLPEAYEQDGFIHCTNGLDQLVKVANFFYKDDDRSHMVLILDVSKITSPVQYDDPKETYPHIYGPLNTDAAIAVLIPERAGDGEYIRFSPTD